MNPEPPSKSDGKSNARQPYRNRIAGWLISLSALAMVVWVRLTDDFNSFMEQQSFFLQVMIFAGCLVLFVSGLYIAPSPLSKDAHEEISADNRRPILFLRSFESDTRGVNQNNQIDNPELLLISVFSTIGPTIAIGKPGELLQSVGAHRMYVSHETWQDEVIALMEQAQVIVLTLDTSAGLLWEIEQLTNNNSDAKKLLFVPMCDLQQSKNRKIRRMAKWMWTAGARYNRLVQAARQWEYSRIRREVRCFLPEMPPKIGDAVFLDVTSPGSCEKLNWVATGFAVTMLKHSSLNRVGYEQVRIAGSVRSVLPNLTKINFYGWFNIPTRLYFWLQFSYALSFVILMVFGVLVLIAAAFSEIFLGQTLDELFAAIASP